MNKILNVGILGTDISTKNKLSSLSKSEQVNVFFLDLSNSNIYEKSIDVILTTNEWLYKWRIAIYEFKKRKIPCFYLIDGVLDWDYIWNNWSYIKPNGSFVQPLLSDMIGVVGKNQLRLLTMFNIKKPMCLIGMPRLDTCEIFKAKSTQNIILVCTANTYALNISAEVKVKQALKDLKCFFEENDVVDVIWRIDERLAKSLDILNNHDKDLNNVLRKAKAVITFPSTVALESMLNNIPTCIIDYRNVPRLIKSAWQISNKHEITKTVHELIFPSAEKLLFQQFCIDDQLTQDSTNRLIHCLYELCGINNDSLDVIDVENQKHPIISFNQLNNHLSTFLLDDDKEVQYYLDAYSNECKHLRGVIDYILHALKNDFRNKDGKFVIKELLNHLNNIL